MPLQSAVDVVPLLGAIVGCHCRVLWWGKERVTTNFGGVDVVPLQGAILVCYGWGSGRSAIAGCHCCVLWWGEERVTTNFGGVGVVPLQGAIVVCFGGVDVVPLLGAMRCQSLFHILLLYSGPPISPRHPRKQQ